jgi:hypothetical protein
VTIIEPIFGILLISIGLSILTIIIVIYLALNYFQKRKSSTTEQIALSINEAKNLESTERYEEASLKYDELEMWDNAEVCRRKLRAKVAENLEKAGRYGDAAEIFDELEMWDRAGDCRRMLKTNYIVSANVNIGKNGTISIECPHCSASQQIITKSNEVTCKFCGKNYVIPKKVLDLL